MNLLKKVNKRVLSVVLATSMAFGFAVAPVPATIQMGVIGESVAYAEAHNVTTLPTPDAEGQGGGSSDPFRYYNDRYSTIRPGDVDVPINAMLLLAFNKNATSKRQRFEDPFDMILVNADKIRLYKSSDLSTIIGETKNVSMEMITSAYPGIYNEFNYRNYIYIEHQLLEPGTSYTIVIDPSVQAANGQTIGLTYPNGHTFTFTTAN